MLKKNFFKNKKVLITGHTGFKGSWLAFILYCFGARVYGYSLKAKTKNDNFYLLKLNKKIKNYYYDVRDKNKLKKTLDKIQPHIIFHLAAQSLVKNSYENPYKTFSTNILGTLNILETVRELKSVKSVVIITSDKCYRNKERNYGYQEDDELGGYDPYSASKAAAENTFHSYLNSYFNKKKFKFGIASARAGNVIGGGDWSKDRIIPDFIKSLIYKKKFEVRSPKSTRPWQHIFDLLNGYLILSQKIYKSKNFNGSWNFGPEKNNISVLEVINSLKKFLNDNKKIYFKTNSKIKETNLLSLNIKKSKNKLNWKPKLKFHKSLELTAEWYETFIYNKSQILNISNKQLKYFFYD